MRKNLKWVLTLVGVMAVLALATPAGALAVTSGSTSVQFTVGNQDPAVSAVGIYEATETTAVTTMTPQVEYAIKVTVNDANMLADLVTVKAYLFYDSDNDNSVLTVPPAANVQNAAILTWTNVGSTWTIDPTINNSTWSIIPLNSEAPTLTQTSGTFWFHFKPGKVAMKSNHWDLYAKADDGGGHPGSAYDSVDHTMSWYGEVIIDTASVNFGVVAFGSDFTANTQSNIAATYICNGNYYEAVAVSPTFTGGASGDANLNPAGNPVAGEFSLKVAKDNTYFNAVLAPASPTYVNIDTDTITLENGDQHATNTLWMKVGPSALRGTYTGTVYFAIVGQG